MFMYQIITLLRRAYTPGTYTLTHRRKIPALRRKLKKVSRQETPANTRLLANRRLIAWSLLFTLALVFGPLRTTAASQPVDVLAERAPIAPQHLHGTSAP